ncbi:hypothetical protein Q3G72_035005 [Acer saccharum]|nr:hypothetical protein Q3G72_035005 [Acer saccharum]
MSSTLPNVTCVAHKEVELLEVEIYEDNYNARIDEIAILEGKIATGTNLFSAFYNRLEEVEIYEDSNAMRKDEISPT